ncbi:MAG: AAA family ATPase [Alcaligenaceae bacterium]|nr:AAA family ATPase [Alcaligenaceae bacterium]
MAILFPSLPDHAPTLGFQRELDTLERLALSLPDSYTLFHSIDWTITGETADAHGEVDIVVMNAAGDLLLIEIKAGPVQIHPDRILKPYPGALKRVDQQIRFGFSCLKARLVSAGLRVRLDSCLVLPDYRVGDQQTASMPRSRILDAEEFDFLGSRVQQILPPGEATEVAPRVRAFLRNELNVVQDFSVRHQQIRKTNRRLSEGLATWVPRIRPESGGIVVTGTAGSGKTLLATRLLEEAAGRGQRALYVCFNRSLADCVRSLVPQACRVVTFHELCFAHLESLGLPVDFSDQAIYATAAQAYVQALDQVDPAFDVLVIDEAQDFDPDWLRALVKLVRPGGSWYVLHDDSQILYERSATVGALPATQVVCPDNFRSPREVVDLINLLGLTPERVQARSSHRGAFPEILTYDGSADDLTAVTLRAVQVCHDQGFALQDTAVITWRGLQSSQLNGSHLGPYALQRFTQQFSAQRQPVWTSGELLFESVYRFKGQSAPAVIVTEVEFNRWTEREKRKLFVAMTRAEMHLTLVVSEHTAGILAQAAGLGA